MVDGKKHRVRITRPFFLATTELTVGQIRKILAASDYKTDAERDGKGGWGWNEKQGKTEQAPQFNWSNTGFYQSDDHPATNLSWNDAIAICNGLSQMERLEPYYSSGTGEMLGGTGYRLPTEAEWEYACRAGTTTRYQHGNDPESLLTVGNIADAALKAKGGAFTEFPTVAGRDGYAFTAPVGEFRPNDWGLFDMVGNVWEWCFDEYQADFYAKSPVDDPVRSPRGAAERVIRGGSWYGHGQDARSAQRLSDAPYNRTIDLGIRLARDHPEAR
jgi:formylglycine-generating enzyme required for sulfatase activity